jgi:hypothetical protein
MDTNEKRFFEQIAQTSNEGWTLKLAAHLKPGEMNLSDYTALLYVVDTSTGWTGAGAITVEGFALARASAQASGWTTDQMADSTGALISKLGREDAPHDSPELAQCLQVMAAALTGTQTFEIAKPSGLDGHWVYIGYRMLDGSTICRPLFFRSGGQGFIPPEALTDVVRRVVVQDTKATSSTVGRMLKRSGGALLAEIYA